jgi:hypothetical protein
METGIVRRGAHHTSTPTESGYGYGWAVPNYTYNASQYAPGPMPAPAWPRSSYSVFGHNADYAGVGEFLTQSAAFSVPNWALLLGGGYMWHKLSSGKRVPMRSNPYGFPFLLTGLAVGGAAAFTQAGDWTSGYSGTGLFLGLALGGLYALKSKDQLITTALGGALIGWGLGTAYEKYLEPEEQGGALTKAWDALV